MGSTVLKERPYWLDTATVPAAVTVPLPSHVDVAIIGAGITGLCAARSLVNRGATVAVLEANTIGWGASSRNGGMVLTGLKLGPRTLVARYGLDLARRLFDASLAAIDCVEQLIAAEHIDCHFARCGHLALACTPAHYRRFRNTAELLVNAFGHSVRAVSGAELRAEIGSNVYHGALVDEASAGLNPARYVAGLARAASAAGAVLCEAAPVERLERHGPRWRIMTARGTLDAGELIVATSGYTGAVTPALRRRIVPIGSYVIATEPLPESLARDLSPRGRMMYDSRRFLHYFRLTPERRLLIGGRACFVPETEATVRESAAQLRRAMIRIFPQLRVARVEYAWGGTLDFAFDTMPHLGRMHDLYYALGYAGHGVAMATYLGTCLGESIGGTELKASPFAQIPFPRAPLGLYWGKPWFLPLAAAWYRFLDRLS